MLLMIQFLTQCVMSLSNLYLLFSAIAGRKCAIFDIFFWLPLSRRSKGVDLTIRQIHRVMNYERTDSFQTSPFICIEIEKRWSRISLLYSEGFQMKLTFELVQIYVGSGGNISVLLFLWKTLNSHVLIDKGIEF